jgi:hypothetical protein
MSKALHIEELEFETEGEAGKYVRELERRLDVRRIRIIHLRLDWHGDTATYDVIWIEGKNTISTKSEYGIKDRVEALTYMIDFKVQAIKDGFKVKID